MNVKMFETFDLTFNSEFTINPFVELELYALFDDDDKKYHGFYNGDNEFVIRLNFDLEGDFNYKVYSNLDELNGKTGSINVAKNTDPNKHGQLVLSDDNKNRLFYKDGTHYNLFSFECDWLFAVSYDDQEKMTRTKRLVEEIAENKFNQVVMNVYANDLQWEKADEWQSDPKIKKEHNNSAREDIFPFLGSNKNPDHSALNVDFFKHFDNVIKILDENNVIAHIMIYVWNKKVNWPNMNTVEDDMYFDYVVKRYSAFSNVLWDISKEALYYGRCGPEYVIDRILRLKKLNPFKRLLTVHEYGFCAKYPELVDIISIQTWVVDSYAKMREIIKEHPDKVFHNVEHGGYEEGDYQIFTGNYTGAEILLRRSYEIIFAGVYGSYYWQPLSWSVTMMPWEGEYKPKLHYYKYLLDFFEEHDFRDYEAGKNVGHGGYFLLHKDEQKTLVYFPKENSAVTVGNMFANQKRVKYKFFNTVTGKYSEECIKEGKQHCIYRSPFKDADSILVAEIVS